MLSLVAQPTAPHEKDLLTGNETCPLILRDLCRRANLTIQSVQPWTHERLYETVREARVTEFVSEHHGADAFLGRQWIGSTEI